MIVVIIDDNPNGTSNNKSEEPLSKYSNVPLILLRKPNSKPMFAVLFTSQVNFGFVSLEAIAPGSPALLYPNEYNA